MRWSWVSGKRDTVIDDWRKLADTFERHLREARSERDEAMAELTALKSQTKSFDPPAINKALKTLGVFVKAGWDIIVECRPDCSKPYRCFLTGTDGMEHAQASTSSWADAVAGDAQRVIDHDGKLPDPLPEGGE